MKKWRLRLLAPACLGGELPSHAIAAEGSLEEYSAHISLATTGKPAYKKLLAAACCKAHNYIKQGGLVEQRAKLTEVAELAKFEEEIRCIAYWENRAIEKIEEDIENSKGEMAMVAEEIKKVRVDLHEKQNLLGALNVRIRNGAVPLHPSSHDN